jgi:hypothetical protein
MNSIQFVHTRALTYLNARLSRPTFINSIARRSYGIKPTSSRTRSRTNLTRLLFFYIHARRKKMNECNEMKLLVLVVLVERVLQQTFQVYDLYEDQLLFHI